MAANILLLSTEYTGHGHRSISEALCQQFENYSSLVKVTKVDAFKIGGFSVYLMGKIYSPLTTYARFIWKAYYYACHFHPSYMNAFGVFAIRKRLLSIIAEIKPNIIVTLHPGYVGCVLDILEKEKIDIPVFVQIADLVSLNSIWADKRAQFTVCPTFEAKQTLIQYGVPENKIRVLGFPVRKQFCNENISLQDNIDKGNKKLKLLIINGCEKITHVIKIIETLLQMNDNQITFIAGQNKKLETKLKEVFYPQYSNRLIIKGYISNLHDYMSDHDIIFTRAGPNILMEAISCCIPVVMTGFLPGQEEGNPDFITTHGLGLMCNRIENINSILNELISDNHRKLKEIQYNQFKFRDLHAAKKITDFILEQI
jgi:UDP-N-acetylglucosamine:LPS N-acetylglucosamine transferase